MLPSPAKRDELLKGFARALFKGDMDALYRVVAPDFLWSFHDGLVTTKALAGPAAIREHLAEQKAMFSAQRFHEVVYHHAADATFMTFCVSDGALIMTETARSRSHTASPECREWLPKVSNGWQCRRLR